VIPFGVRLDLVEHYQNDGMARSECPQILMVGHIHPFRNPVQLVRSMVYILKRIPNARLVLAGRIDLKEPLQVARQLGFDKEQVEFRGGIAHEEVIRLMRTSQVFAHWLTGPYLALGTASMEAMLCETPVVTDLREDLFGEEKLRNVENIVLIDSKDPQSIAGTIIRLLQDEDLRRKIGRAGRRFVLEHLNWQEIAQQMEEFYAQILEKRIRPVFVGEANGALRKHLTSGEGNPTILNP
jgi:phosphatidylinositol alpha-1,6-mannosyltransferase